MMHLLETEKIHGTIRILVIEDDSDYRELIAENLQTESPGAIVDCATGFRDATERIKSGKYNHIYLDYSLKEWGHGPTGLDMLPTIRAHSPSTEVIAISSELEHNRKMVAAGAARSCLKSSLMRRREEVLVA